MLLETQFPELPRFQPTLYTQALENLHPAEEGSLFFHNFSNHWAVSQLSQGRVHLYDSLQPKKIKPELQTQLATLYGHVGSEKELRVFMPQVQVQRGGVDCGCFAVAFAVSLLFGDDPTTLLYSQQEMRGHLEGCLQSQLFTPFPASEKKAKRKLKTIEHTISLWTYIYIYIYIACKKKMQYFFDVKFIVHPMESFDVAIWPIRNDWNSYNVLFSPLDMIGIPTIRKAFLGSPSWCLI